MLVCRYVDLRITLSRLGSARFQFVPPCTEPAVHTSVILLAAPGHDIEVYTQTCHAHDRQAQGLYGYDRSTALRPPDPLTDPL